MHRETPAVPRGSANVFSIVDFGAAGDGKTKNTAAAQRAIDACAETGGGTVYVPAGTFLTGALRLRSNITLYLDAGAVLLFSGDFDDCPTVRTLCSSGEFHGYSPLIYGCDLSNIAITGRGTIDGQGGPWWEFTTATVLPNYRAEKPWLSGVAEDHPVKVRAREFAQLDKLFEPFESDYDGWREMFARPPLIRLLNCRNVLLSGNTHQNSPSWNTHLLCCDNVCVDGVTFLNPPHAPNGDGLDIESSTNVRVANCFFRVKDDCLCLKSGRDEYGRKAGRPTANVTVSNCIMDRGHGGVVFGSEMSGGIRNVVISNCLFSDGVPRGLRIKSNRRRGGIVEDIRATNIIMTNVDFLVTMHAYYGCGVRPEDLALIREEPQPVSETTPVLRNVHLSNITAKGVRTAAGYIHGLPEMPITGISLQNVVVEMTDDPDEKGAFVSPPLDDRRMAGDGFFLRHAADVSFRDVTVSTRQGASLYAGCVERLDVAGFRTARPHPDTPLLDFENVSAALVAQCRTPEGGSLIQVRGASEDVTVDGVDADVGARPPAD